MDVNGLLMYGIEMEIFFVYFCLFGVNKIFLIKEFNILLNVVF